MVRIAPSVLSADFLHLQDDVEIMEKAGVDLLHMDIMDGMYVPNISYGPMILKAIRKISNIPMDVHLMIEKPSRYFDVYKEIGVEYLTIHKEASIHTERDLQQIRKLGMKSGLAINPGTSEEEIKYLLDACDLVLVMSVNPGFGGQKFIPSVLDKIKNLKKMIKDRNLSTKIEVDGGIGLDQLKTLKELGADILVSGSSLFKGDFTQNFNSFKEILDD